MNLLALQQLDDLAALIEKAFFGSADALAEARHEMARLRSLKQTIKISEHDHRHGKSIGVFLSDSPVTIEMVTEASGEEFEEDQGEEISIYTVEPTLIVCEEPKPREGYGKAVEEVNSILGKSKIFDYFVEGNRKDFIKLLCSQKQVGEESVENYTQLVLSIEDNGDDRAPTSLLSITLTNQFMGLISCEYLDHSGTVDDLLATYKKQCEILNLAGTVAEDEGVSFLRGVSDFVSKTQGTFQHKSKP